MEPSLLGQEEDPGERRVGLWVWSKGAGSPGASTVGLWRRGAPSRGRKGKRQKRTEGGEGDEWLLAAPLPHGL